MDKPVPLLVPYTLASFVVAVIIRRTDGTCYDGNHQDPVIRQQLYKKHACVDLRDYCRSIAVGGTGTLVERCSTDLKLQAHCPHTCRVCHNRTRTVPAAAEEDADGPVDAAVSAPLEHQPEGAPRATTPTTQTGASNAAAVDDGHNSSSSPRSAAATTAATATTPAKKTRRKKRRGTSKYRNDIDAVIPALGSDLGVPQLVANATLASKIHQVVDDARDYVQNVVMVDDLYWTVRDKCVNRHELCAQHAAEGKCGVYEGEEDAGPEWVEFMQTHCAPVCQTCDQLHYVARCPVDMNQRNAWYPGDADAMFERIVNDPVYRQYHNATVLSRPNPPQDDDSNVVDGPWLIYLENFTTPEEAARLIELGGVVGYERSEDVGDEDETGEIDSVVSVGRTSTNAWCDPKQCENDPVVQPLIERMEKLTGITREYTEHLQLLKYEVGQFYEEHHDYIEIDRMRYSGVRILTVFLYLNTVERGGATNFPLLGPTGISVQPRQGRVVLWPSVLDDDPHAKDDRTNHQAMPVQEGIKYGANAWYHQRQFRTGYDLGC
jgi:prolyl 4-hydroxylase